MNTLHKYSYILFSGAGFDFLSTNTHFVEWLGIQGINTQHGEEKIQDQASSQEANGQA